MKKTGALRLWAINSVLVFVLYLSVQQHFGFWDLFFLLPSYFLVVFLVGLFHIIYDVIVLRVRNVKRMLVPLLFIPLFWLIYFFYFFEQDNFRQNAMSADGQYLCVFKEVFKDGTMTWPEIQLTINRVGGGVEYMAVVQDEEKVRLYDCRWMWDEDGRLWFADTYNRELYYYHKTLTGWGKTRWFANLEKAKQDGIFPPSGCSYTGAIKIRQLLMHGIDPLRDRRFGFTIY